MATGKWWPSVALAGGLAILLGSTLLTWQLWSRPSAEHYRPVTIIPLQATFYDEIRWRDALKEATTITPEHDVAAIVVPHHLLAAKIMGGMFGRAANTAVQLVVVVGPNHNQVSPYAIATVHGEWATPFGKVITDTSALNAMMVATDAREVPELFGQEHAAGAMMPFIAHAFPNAQVVTALFRTEAGEYEARKVEEWIATLDPTTTRVVCSIDFSHYLPEDIAARHDIQTRRVFQTLDLATASRMTNADVDSKATLITAMLQAQRLESVFEEIYHGNSNDFGLTKTASTTSYFGMLLRRK